MMDDRKTTNLLISSCSCTLNNKTNSTILWQCAQKYKKYTFFQVSLQPNRSQLISSSYFTFVVVLFLHDFQDPVQKFNAQALQNVCAQVFNDSPDLGWPRC